MKKLIVFSLYAFAALLMAGCAKQVEDGPNDTNKRIFDAWIGLNHENATRTDLGVYVLPEGNQQGTGAEVTEDGFAFLEYTITDLSGNISSYTGAETAKQLGTYNETYYYGAKVQPTASGTILAGLADVLIGMKVGGKKKFIIPNWLMSYQTHSTEEEYLAISSAYASSIYDIHVVDFADNIKDWQIDTIGKYFAKNADIFNGMTSKDSLKTHSGMYYKQLKAPVDTTAFPSDTTIYINYTGQLLNGQIFDTTDERLAKDNGLYDSARTYGPVKIKWGETFSDITMGSESSSIISGFALTLWQMRAMEEGIGVFISDYGYSGSGSGSTIPGYSPLIFKIQIVAEPED